MESRNPSCFERHPDVPKVSRRIEEQAGHYVSVMRADAPLELTHEFYKMFFGITILNEISLALALKQDVSQDLIDWTNLIVTEKTEVYSGSQPVVTGGEFVGVDGWKEWWAGEFKP
jgi:hypothetical protein